VTEFDPGAWRSKKRLALLIGIDDYRGKDLNPLRGCINDVRRLAELLGDKYNFAVACLYDQEATREAILAAMQMLLDAAGEGSQVVFAWSGHGSRIPLADGSFHETLVPCDSSRIGWSGNRDITDRELYGWVCQTIEKKAGLTLIIDGCRAGGAIRDMQPRPRGATAETDNKAMIQEKSAFLPVEFDPAKVGESGWLPVSKRYTLLAACLSSEFCTEVEDSNGKKRGLFSYHLQNALASQREGLSWRDVFERFSPAVTLRNSTQHPQLEGNIDRLVFEQQDFPPNFYLPLLPSANGRMALAGGAIHGVSKGSIWSILPAGSRKAADHQELAQLLIEDVGGTRSEGSLRGRISAETTTGGLRAFETSRPVDRSFRVLLAPTARADQELRTLIQKSPFLTLEPGTEAERAMVILHLLPARSDCKPGEPLPQLPRLDKESWVLLDAGGAQLATPFPLCKNGHRSEVVAKLETLARHRFLRGLEHPDPRLSLAGSIQAEAFRLHENPRFEVIHTERLGEQPVLKPGSRIAFRLINGHSKPLLVTLIGLGLSGNVDLLHPPCGRNEWVDPGNSLNLGFHAADALELGLPSNYPFPGEPAFNGADDFLLFLFTEAATRNLELMQHRGAGQGRKSNPADLALKMATGKVLRSDAPADALMGQEAWGIVRWKFFLQP
jgi:hypothetical protein